MKRITKVSGCFSRIFGSILATIAGSTAKADVMPWSGASASVQVFGPVVSASNSTGTMPSVSDQKTIPVRYNGVNYGSGPNPKFTVNVTGSADAAATGQANNLLSVGATYSAPNPGTRP